MYMSKKRVMSYFLVVLSWRNNLSGCKMYYLSEMKSNISSCGIIHSQTAYENIQLIKIFIAGKKLMHLKICSHLTVASSYCRSTATSSKALDVLKSSCYDSESSVNWKGFRWFCACRNWTDHSNWFANRFRQICQLVWWSLWTESTQKSHSFVNWASLKSRKKIQRAWNKLRISQQTQNVPLTFPFGCHLVIFLGTKQERSGNVPCRLFLGSMFITLRERSQNVPCRLYLGLNL